MFQLPFSSPLKWHCESQELYIFQYIKNWACASRRKQLKDRKKGMAMSNRTCLNTTYIDQCLMGSD